MQRNDTVSIESIMAMAGPHPHLDRMRSPVEVRRIALGLTIEQAATLMVTLAGCTSVPIPPTYTQDERRVICERQRGWWHLNGLRGGYCEYRL